MQKASRHFRRWTCAVLPVFLAWPCLGQAQAQDQIEAQVQTKAHVYPRGSKCLLRMKVAGADSVRFDVGGWLEKTVPVKDGFADYELDTSRLKVNDYHVRAVLLRGGKSVHTTRWPVTVARPHDPERMPVWKWGDGIQNQSLYMQCGFTGGWLCSLRSVDGSASPKSYDETFTRGFEEAARNDFDFGLHLRPLSSENGAFLESSHGTLPSGKKAADLYPLTAQVLTWCGNLAGASMEHFGQFPTLRHVLLSSEYHTPMVLHPQVIKMAREEIGIDITKLKFSEGYQGAGGIDTTPAESFKNGIIADDNPEYRFLKWWWERGHGTAGANREMGDVIHRSRPDVITWHEPYRLAPVRKTHAGLDMIGTWTYGWPDIKRLCYTTYLQAAARPGHQKVQQDITLFVYGHTAISLKQSTARYDLDFPGGDPNFTVGPDYVREAIWLVLSQRPDCLAFYSDRDFSPEDPEVTSPATLYAIGEIAQYLIKPYGPAILDCERVKPQTAVLASAVATWFHVGEWNPGYPGEQTLPYATLLMQNHVPFDVLLDDDVLEGRLKEYKLLVMPVAGTLTQTMADRIKAYAGTGGRVIVNKPFRTAQIPATVTSFSFDHQNRMNGTLAGRYVTADEDRSIMGRYATVLATHLAGIDRPASCDSQMVLTNSLVGGDITYHFFINDKRTYGPRFGKYKLREELGLAQTAKGAVQNKDNSVVLYDVLRQVPIKYEARNGRAEFDLSLSAARGKIVAALPEPVKGVEITAGSSAGLGESVGVVIRVLGKSGNPFRASMPLKVTITDPLGRVSEWSRYTTTRRTANGACQFTFAPAVNDEAGPWEIDVVDMVAGTKAHATIRCHAKDSQ